MKEEFRLNYSLYTFESDDLSLIEEILNKAYHDSNISIYVLPSKYQILITDCKDIDLIPYLKDSEDRFHLNCLFDKNMSYDTYLLNCFMSLFRLLKATTSSLKLKKQEIRNLEQEKLWE